MNKVTPLIKGLITGLAMVAISLWLYYYKIPANSPFTYLLYLFYLGGIVWTIYGYAVSKDYSGKFGDIFMQGFRCFIIIAIVMVTYTGIFIKTNPNVIEEDSKMFREALVSEKNKTPAEKEIMIAQRKEQYLTSYVSVTIFSTLIMGSIFTAAGAGLLIMRRK